MASIAYLLFYEAARQLPMETRRVETPLEMTQAPQLSSGIVLAAILRAGLGFLDGILPACPEARVAYLGLSRDPESLEAHSYYQNLPNLSASDEVFVLDPMLATGHTAVCALKALKSAGAQRMKLVVLVASPEGIARVHEAYPSTDIFTASVDTGLNGKGYIYPGLGDAGDRLYGTLAHVLSGQRVVDQPSS
jgi:uracil phosphoribosyltransferase